MENIKRIKFTINQKAGDVSGIFHMPGDPEALLVMAHGAGAPMNHPFMNKTAEYLADEGIGSFRYNFPYTEKKSKRIDSAPILMETIRAAVNKAKELAGDTPLFAGGKSMGGRMTSQAAADAPLPGVRGIIFFGFPLHPPGKESTERAEHLYNVNLPMLFLQGTRDKLASLGLLKPVITKIGNKAHLHIADGADHSFHVLKSSGRTDDDVMVELARKVSAWTQELLKSGQ